MEKRGRNSGLNHAKVWVTLYCTVSIVSSKLAGCVRKVILVLKAPEVSIVDERDKAVGEKFYKGGSTIALKCVVRQIVGEAPDYIIWHHEDRMLNYDTHRGGIRYVDHRLAPPPFSACYQLQTWWFSRRFGDLVGGHSLGVTFPARPPRC